MLTDEILDALRKQPRTVTRIRIHPALLALLKATFPLAPKEPGTLLGLQWELDQTIPEYPGYKFEY